MENFNWTCPYCNRSATITDQNHSRDDHDFAHGNKDGRLLIRTEVIVCPNDGCKEYAINGQLFKHVGIKNTLGPWVVSGEPLMRWSMRPDSSAKPFPDYIPAAIIADYNDACRIKDLSPKASAIMSRRCLQGMIRDFFKVEERTLAAEIRAIQEQIDPKVWRAIDAVRQMGNIGAHMEKDVNLIIDVEPEEAESLTRLIEYLLKEWYVASHEKEKDMESIVATADAKAERRNSQKSTRPADDSTGNIAKGQ